MADQTITPPHSYCKNCRFWAYLTSDFTNAAECRRGPPVRSSEQIDVRFANAPTMITRERGRGLWPLVGEHDGCGEFASL